MMCLINHIVNVLFNKIKSLLISLVVTKYHVFYLRGFTIFSFPPETVQFYLDLMLNGKVT